MAEQWLVWTGKVKFLTTSTLSVDSKGWPTQTPINGGHPEVCHSVTSLGQEQGIAIRSIDLNIASCRAMAERSREL